MQPDVFGLRQGPNKPLGCIKQQNSYQFSCGAMGLSHAEGWLSDCQYATWTEHASGRFGKIVG
jgi:hypothetical protein